MVNRIEIPEEYKLGNIAQRITPKFQTSLNDGPFEDGTPFNRMANYLSGTKLISYFVNRGDVTGEIELGARSPHPALVHYNGARNSKGIIEFLIIENDVRRLTARYTQDSGIAVLEVGELYQSELLSRLYEGGHYINEPRPRPVLGIALTHDLKKLEDVLERLS